MYDLYRIEVVKNWRSRGLGGNVDFWHGEIRIKEVRIKVLRKVSTRMSFGSSWDKRLSECNFFLIFRIRRKWKCFDFLEVAWCISTRIKLPRMPGLASHMPVARLEWKVIADKSRLTKPLLFSHFWICCVFIGIKQEDYQRFFSASVSVFPWISFLFFFFLLIPFHRNMCLCVCDYVCVRDSALIASSAKKSETQDC